MKTTKMIAKIAGVVLAGMMALAAASCNEKNGGAEAVGADGLTKAQAKLLQEKPAPEADFEFELSKDGSYVTITEYKGKAKTLVIPATIQGLPVKLDSGTGIFYLGNSSVTSLVIPEGIESIGYSAFFNASKLATVVLPSTLKEIGGEAFSFCKKLTTINFPEGLQSIGGNAFWYSGLKEIKLPEGLLYLGTGVFDGNENLTVLSLPSSLRFIVYGVKGSGTIAGDCDKLEQITIPENISVLRFYREGSSWGGNFSELITGTKIKESVALQQLLKSRTIKKATDEQQKEYKKLAKEFHW